MEDTGAIERAFAGVSNISDFEKRIVVTGLVSSKTESAGILIVGIEPEKDRRMITMVSYLTEGEFLTSERPDGVYLGDKLARQLKLRLGDELVLMTSALDGSMGAELATIVGIFHSNSQTFDKTIAYVHLELTQSLLAAEDEINNFVFKLEDPSRMEETRADLERALAGKPVQVVTWEEIDFELVGIRDYQDALLDIVLVVVFIIVALGILNTLLMAMFERIREFGVLMAIGARPSVIRWMIVLEAGMIGALGTVIGLSLGAGIILYYRWMGLYLPLGESVGFFMPFDSVLYLRFKWSRHALALFVVFLTSLLASLPPAWKASRMRPADSLRHL